ncbi:DUF4157 domain-containing protein [Myxococcota bacterium]|nr:DUF4157 domain-containing protein [Myxococcota bacterium]MBU1430796.1 DUF4157 domain-containing protein [Myxococcota bacterium]MBU1900120.1 DUF4157 domain-containing protein [Myxococcota bacterium]
MSETPLHDLLISDPLEPTAYSPYGELRDSAAGWARRDPEAAAFGEALLDMEGLLSRSYLLGQPNVAGMGLAAWDLAAPEPRPLIDPERGARRMLGQRAEGEPPPEAPMDASALKRGADLLMALDQLKAAEATLPIDRPEAVERRLSALRVDLQRRLTLERKHSPELDRLIREGRAIPTPAPAPEEAPPARALASPTRGPLADQAPSRIFALAMEGQISPELSRLAMEIARLTGEPVEHVLSAARPKPRRARGADGPRRRPTPLQIAQISVEGLRDPQTAAVIDRALALLPQALGGRLTGAEGLHGAGDVHVEIDAGQIRDARGLSDRLADALIAGGYTEAHLHLGVTALTVAGPQDLMSLLASDDIDTLSAALRGERQQLDGALMSRLTGFFGRDLKEVMVFSGPMSGALARSLKAEAITHGKMVFFDPKHFQPSSPTGEALLAHELTHTVQEGEWDSRAKEAQALAVEAEYLDWIRPGGAPFAVELDPLDATAPSAAAASDVSGGVLRAEQGRGAHKGADRTEQGPRTDTARFEERVAQVLEHIRAQLDGGGAFEHDRFGRVANPFDAR